MSVGAMAARAKRRSTGSKDAPPKKSAKVVCPATEAIVGWPLELISLLS